MKAVLFIYLTVTICLGENLKAQISDNFNDGNYTANPSWYCSSNNFIINSNFQLQSNSNTANSTSVIYTTNTMATATQWELKVTLDFNTSSTNYVDIFLTASSSDLSAATTNGYFIRMGGTADEICLYRKDGVTIVKIIDGLDGVLNTASNQVKLKVTRDALNKFTLYRDLTGSGNVYFAEGSATDTIYTSTFFFGILIRQSTASFFQQHYFDDIVVKTYIPDLTPPAVLNINASTANRLAILFDEAVTQSSVASLSNYFANNAIGFPVAVSIDVLNAATVHLVFATNFPNGINCNLTISGVKDYAGNELNNAVATFSYYHAQQYDIVIDEVMADPNPTVLLPAVEWIELKNCSAHAINLNGWKLSDGISSGGSLPNYILPSDSFLILCSSSTLPVLSVYGNVIAVNNFPSLNDDKDQLLLTDEQGQVIHSINYSNTWYKNELKKNGGWSLEMINTKTPCIGINNWIASVSNIGGTPAKINSVDDIIEDEEAPHLLRAYAIDSLHIRLIFDEPLSCSTASIIANYQINDGIGNPTEAITISPTFDKVELLLLTPLQRGKIYIVTVSNLTDCVGNFVGSKKTAKVGLSELADSMDVVINEILFNPPANGKDYVEIYNRSKKIINLKQLFVANRNTIGEISSIVSFSEDDYLIFPQDYIIITEDAGYVKKAFLTQNPDVLIALPLLPSFNDDKGAAIILNATGNIVDELLYQDDWHFELINNTEGVSLERIDCFSATQSKDNWHSASTNVGFGTPTYKNSQSNSSISYNGEIKISPEIVSPDNDGHDDFATITYQFLETGNVMSNTIFDAAGRVVRLLQQNALCGTRGSFKWDGLGEKNTQLSSGIYIVFTELFNTKGNKKKFKNVIVVAGKR